MPNWESWGPTANERQIVSILVVGYIHSKSKPAVANAQLPLRPTHGWWFDRLALLTVPYYSPNWCFRDRRIDLPDEEQCSPHARVATSHSTEAQLPSWRDQTMTAALLLNYLLGYVLTSQGLRPQTVRTPWLGSRVHQADAWLASHLLLWCAF